MDKPVFFVFSWDIEFYGEDLPLSNFLTFLFVWNLNKSIHFNFILRNTLECFLDLLNSLFIIFEVLNKFSKFLFTVNEISNFGIFLKFSGEIRNIALINTWYLKTRIFVKGHSLVEILHKKKNSFNDLEF